MIKQGGRLLLDSPNSESLFRKVAILLNRHRNLLSTLNLEASFENAYRKMFNPGRFYYYSPQTYTKLLSLAGFTVTDVVMRQPRYIVYGKDSLSPIVSTAMQAMSIVERITGKESWVEIRATKTKEIT